MTGAQQKTQHNLRLICIDILSFCSEGREEGNNQDSMRLNPRRIETAMSLYTSDLTAIIMTTDSQINTLSGMKEGMYTVLNITLYICSRGLSFEY